MMASDINSTDKEFTILELGAGKKCINYYFVHEPHANASLSDSEWLDDEKSMPKRVNLNQSPTGKSTFRLPIKKIQFKEVDEFVAKWLSFLFFL